MAGNKRDKYLHKCTVEYTDVGGASCPGKRKIKYFHKCIVEYI
jgi:hypothetical protein